MDKRVVRERFESLQPPLTGRPGDHVWHEDDAKAGVLVEHLTDGGDRPAAWRDGHDDKIGGLERAIGCKVRAWVSVDDDRPGSPSNRPPLEGVSDVVSVELGGAQIRM